MGGSPPGPLGGVHVLDEPGVVRSRWTMLTQQAVIDHALSLPGAWPDEPWEGDVVAKVADKIFAFTGQATVGVKCGRSRVEADEWLKRFPDDASVMAYIGRYGWNTLRIGGAIADEEILDAIEASYLDVVERLPRSKRP